MPVPPCVQAWHRPCEFGTWSVSSWRHTSVMGASSAAVAQSLSSGAGLSSRGICCLPASAALVTQRESTQCICACICKNIGAGCSAENATLPVRRRRDDFCRPGIFVGSPDLWPRSWPRTAVHRCYRCAVGHLQCLLMPISPAMKWWAFGLRIRRSCRANLAGHCAHTEPSLRERLRHRWTPPARRSRRPLPRKGPRWSVPEQIRSTPAGSGRLTPTRTGTNAQLTYHGTVQCCVVKTRP